ncbi:MAG: hypothetical protein AB1752_01555 [Candidatus Zixiibacteriota bacterium]
MKRWMRFLLIPFACGVLLAPGIADGRSRDYRSADPHNDVIDEQASAQKPDEDIVVVAILGFRDVFVMRIPKSVRDDRGSESTATKSEGRSVEK